LLSATQASGIQVADVCVTTYQQLKLGKKFKYILFTLNDNLSEIVVEKTSDAPDFETFVEDLPKDQCRWAVYDFEFEKDGKRNKLSFVSWYVLFRSTPPCEGTPEGRRFQGRSPLTPPHQVSRRCENQR